jgi:hypothetical protein
MDHLSDDRVCSNVVVFKKLAALAMLSSLLAACSSGSPSAAPRATPPATTHPLGVPLSEIEHFFNTRGARPGAWTQGANDTTSGPLNGMDTYTGGMGRLKLEVIGDPTDETELSVEYGIGGAADARAANALMLKTVQQFAPGAVAWIRGALAADDGTAGYFGGSGALDTSGQVALSFSTSDTNRKGLSLILTGGKIP